MSGIDAWAFEAFADVEVEWLHGSLLFADTMEEMTRGRQYRARYVSLLEFKERECRGTQG
ncbi:[LSU ribosomal protein L3P]-glutamine N5-methyltransferase [Pseudomonas sp. St29]|nr:[LSU ribosomal protein L3P]-glutamine N5-methyltransferase [Pseudomonas sp. St29]